MVFDFTSAIAQKVCLINYSDILMLQGKFIEIHFTAAGKICGSKIRTCKHVEIEKITGILDTL